MKDNTLFYVYGVDSGGGYCESVQQITDEVVRGQENVGAAVLRALAVPDVSTVTVGVEETTEWHEAREPFAMINLAERRAAEEAEYERKQAQRAREQAEADAAVEGWF